MVAGYSGHGSRTTATTTATKDTVAVSCDHLVKHVGSASRLRRLMVILDVSLRVPVP